MQQLNEAYNGLQGVNRIEYDFAYEAFKRRHVTFEDQFDAIYVVSSDDNTENGSRAANSSLKTAVRFMAVLAIVVVSVFFIANVIGAVEKTDGTTVSPVSKSRSASVTPSAFSGITVPTYQYSEQTEATAESTNVVPVSNNNSRL